MSTDVCGCKSAHAKSNNFQFLLTEARAEDVQWKQKWSLRHCASIRSAAPSLSLYFLSVLMTSFFCHRVCEVMGHWTLSMAHLVLLTVKSVSLAQNSYSGHCGLCLLKASDMRLWFWVPKSHTADSPTSQTLQIPIFSQLPIFSHQFVATMSNRST